METTDVKLLNKKNIAELPQKPGIYKIYAYSQNFKPIEINRFAKKDKQGILYIGRTINIKTRLNNFFLSSNINKNTYNHSGAVKYKENNIIRKTLQKHTLYFYFQILKESEIKEIETDLLKKYSSKFGEYPPLNK